MFSLKSACVLGNNTAVMPWELTLQHEQESAPSGPSSHDLAAPAVLQHWMADNELTIEHADQSANARAPGEALPVLSWSDLAARAPPAAAHVMAAQTIMQHPDPLISVALPLITAHRSLVVQASPGAPLLLLSALAAAARPARTLLVIPARIQRGLKSLASSLALQLGTIAAPGKASVVVSTYDELVQVTSGEKLPGWMINIKTVIYHEISDYVATSRDLGALILAHNQVVERGRAPVILATASKTSKELDALLESLIPVRDVLTGPAQKPPHIEFTFCGTHESDRLFTLRQVLQDNANVMPCVVFTHEVDKAVWLTSKLEESGITTVACISNTASRAVVTEAFSAGKVWCVVTSDSVAMDISLPGVSTVVHYGPPELDNFVRRNALANHAIVLYTTDDAGLIQPLAAAAAADGANVPQWLLSLKALPRRERERARKQLKVDALKRLKGEKVTRKQKSKGHKAKNN